MLNAFKVGDELITLYEKNYLGKIAKYQLSKYDKNYNVIAESDFEINEKERHYYGSMQMEGQVIYLLLQIH